MPDWLIEGDPLVLLLIAAAGVVCLFVWYRGRQKAWLAATVACALLAGLFLLLDYRYESDREQINANVQAMAAAVKPRDYATLFSFIASEFNYRGRNKADFQRICEGASQRFQVKELVIWNFQVTSLDKASHTAEVDFQFKVHWLERQGFLGEEFYRCKAEFTKEADGQWRIRGVRIFPLSTADQELTIPGF